MKSEILKILEMQEQGKLTRDQAAELLAVLADGAREKNSSTGVPRPPRAGGGPCGCSGTSGPGAFQDFVDTVADVGTRVGHAASIWGSELLNTVHRDEGGNSVTLSRVDAPAGDAYTFRGNIINVSKLGRFNLTRAELANNTITASKLTRVTMTDGKFSQCEISGSSLDDLTITAASLRGASFSGTKCVRLRLEGNSTLDSTAVQATSLKDAALLDATTVRASTINRCSISDMTLRKTTWDQVKISDCKADGLTLEECAWTNCQLIACKLRGTKIRGVKLEGKILRNLDLSGKTIEGNDAFDQVTGSVAPNY